MIVINNIKRIHYLYCCYCCCCRIVFVYAIEVFTNETGYEKKSKSSRVCPYPRTSPPHY